MTRIRSLLLAAALLGGAGLMVAVPSSAQEGVALPEPALDLPAGPDLEVAVLAGGCFWGVQGVFQHVDGVLNAVSGYAGGTAETASYDLVSMGATGHAEAVAITYDPREISYGRLLQVFFSAAHDPTQLNRQGPDVGTQYRSAIFPQDAAQAEIARSYIAQLEQAGLFDAAIATTIELDTPFYPAEDYHQDFMELNPTWPYIVFHDLPKLDTLRRLFPELYREDPALVSEASS